MNPCFNSEPHAPHEWTLYYSDPPSKQDCPGIIRFAISERLEHTDLIEAGRTGQEEEPR